MQATCHPERKAHVKGECKRCYSRNYWRARHLGARQYGTGPDPLVKRRSMLMRKYGITVEQYDAMYKQQAGACAICGGGFAVLDVDHNHGTGQVRGLLCRSCNLMLGHVEKNGALVDLARAYLKGHNNA